MSGILLDTNALLWTLTGSTQLGPAARRLFTSGMSVRFSSISVLEISIKHMLGRIPQTPRSISASATEAGLTELAFTSQHAEAILALPELVRHDPFDRMLLAQAKEEGIPLLTSDSVLLQLTGVGAIDARS